MWICKHCDDELEFVTRQMEVTVSGKADYRLPEPGEDPYDPDGDIDGEWLKDSFQERLGDADHEYWMCPNCGEEQTHWCDLARWKNPEDDDDDDDAAPAKLTPAQIEQRERLRQKGLI